MLDLLFGPHRSVQRRACIVLSAIVFVLGIAFAVFEDVPTGMALSVVGVLAGVILARNAESYVARASAHERLGQIGDVDPSNLQHFVEHARSEPSGLIGPLSGEFERDDLAGLAREGREATSLRDREPEAS